MAEPRDSEITRMLIEVTGGNRSVVDEILPLVYPELRRLAGNYMRKERGNHTLQPTALVNEAYMKLVDQKNVKWQNRSHFFAIAAQIMRRLLADHARKHNAEKRGGKAEDASLDEGLNVSAKGSRVYELVALDDALNELALIDETKAKIVELRYFGGLSVEETALAIGVSPITVKRHWRMAKAWLYGRLT